MKVPLLDLKEQLQPIRHEIIKGVTELIDSTGYILGTKVESFEAAAAAYCGTRHGIGVSSGTDALLASLMVLGVGPGDLVLTTPYTFIATLGCILRLGAKPVFADIDPVSFNIDPDNMERILADSKIASKIKVILPVHLYGQCADMARIIDLAARYDIPIVEDAAQAIGASCPLEKDGERTWHRAGSMGAFGCFSFFPSKNLGGIGDGGMITANNDDLACDVKVVRVHGGAPKYHHAVVGGNFRLDPIQAVALQVKLPHLPEWHRARRKNAALYNSLFAESGLEKSGAVKLPLAVYSEEAQVMEDEPDYHIYNQYIIRTERRDQLKDFLAKEEVGTEIYYPIPMHKQKCLEGFGLNDLCFPEAEKASRQTLALPIYPELTNEMQYYVVEKIADFFKTC